MTMVNIGGVRSTSRRAELRSLSGSSRAIGKRPRLGWGGTRHPAVIAVLPLAFVASMSIGLGRAAAQAIVNPQINPGVIQSQTKQNENEIKQQNEQRLVGPAVAPVIVPPSNVGPGGGARFLLKKVVVDKSAFLKPEELDKITAPFIGRRVDISDVQRILKAINDIYADRGLVTARAILPPQTLKNGELRIALVEGKLEKVEVKGNKRLQSDFIRRHISTQEGGVVDVPLLTREVLRANKTGVAQIQASLQPGSSFGLTTIDLAVIEPPAVSLNLFADNQGFESVDRYEGGFLIQGYSPLKLDDRLTLYGVGSAGNLNGNIAYSVPIDYSGGRIGASYTQGRIYIVRGPFTPLGIKGRSDIVSGNVVQPIFATPNVYLLFNGAFSQYGSSSRQTAVPTTDNTTNRGSVGFLFGFQNPTLAFSVAPTFSPGRTKFVLTETGESFNLVGGTFAASYRLPSDFLLTAGGAFQVSSRSLLAGDQLFQIGGPTTVRGYATALFAAPTGYFANLELHHAADFVTQGLDAFVFYDRGSTYAMSPAVTTLNSVGAGLAYDYRQKLIGEVSVGVPLDKPIAGRASFQVYFRVTTRFNSDEFAAAK